MPRLCVLGSANLDLVVQAPRFPRPGETLMGGPFATYAGGKGANQAVAAARLGAEVEFLGCVGDDDGGRNLVRLFEEEGVGIEALEVRRGAATGVGVITVDPAGENHIVVAPGANHLPDAAWVEARAARIRSADLLLLQLEVPLGANLRAAQIARAAGVPVYLNGAPAVELPAEILGLVDTLIVNQHEYELMGLPAVPRLVVTFGKGGARCIDFAADGARTSDHRQGTFPVEVVDTTAAGDAFCAAFAVAAAAGEEMPSCLRWGTAAGALACTIAGAIPALPGLEAVRTLRRVAPLG
jgi:ribokinase